MKRNISYLGSCFIILCLMVSCSGSKLPRLQTEISPTDSTDSILWITYIGKNVRTTDSLIHWPQELELQPDTALFQEALLVHAGGDSLQYFRLEADQWKRRTPTTVAPKSNPKTAIGRSIIDVNQKRYKTQELWKAHPNLIIFAGALDDTTPSDSLLRLQEQRMRKRLGLQTGKDSITRIYYFLTASDSLVRRKAKEQKLRGIICSDSSMQVSSLREQYGIASQTTPLLYQVDTLGKLLR